MLVVSARAAKYVHIQTMAKQKHRKHASAKIHFICRHKYTRRKKVEQIFSLLQFYLLQLLVCVFVLRIWNWLKLTAFLSFATYMRTERNFFSSISEPPLTKNYLIMCLYFFSGDHATYDKDIDFYHYSTMSAKKLLMRSLNSGIQETKKKIYTRVQRVNGWFVGYRIRSAFVPLIIVPC